MKFSLQHCVIIQRAQYVTEVDPAFSGSSQIQFSKIQESKVKRSLSTQLIRHSDTGKLVRGTEQKAKMFGKLHIGRLTDGIFCHDEQAKIETEEWKTKWKRRTYEPFLRSRYNGRQRQNDGSTLFHPLTDDELRYLEKHMDTGSAPGSDELTYAHLRDVKNEGLRMCVVNIIQLSLLLLYIPVMTKTAMMVVIEKLGKDLGLLNNWRPITLLSVVLKQIEMLIARRLRLLADAIPGAIPPQLYDYIPHTSADILLMYLFQRVRDFQMDPRTRNVGIARFISHRARLFGEKLAHSVAKKYKENIPIL